MTEIDLHTPPVSREQLDAERQQTQARMRTLEKRKTRETVLLFVSVILLGIPIILLSPTGTLAVGGSVLVFGLIIIGMWSESRDNNRMRVLEITLHRLAPLSDAPDLASDLRDAIRNSPEICKYVAQISEQGRLPTVGEARALLAWTERQEQEDVLTQIRQIRRSDCVTREDTA